MCGFIGVVSRDASNRFPEDKLRRMNSLIAHRGPDDEGFYFSDWLSLAFRRLKIIDLSEKGHQPMFDITGTHVIVFNGEIYNYKEIRDELIGKGFKFRSDSDTEVLLNSYLCWGKDCLHKFIGMFAFIISDLSNRTLFFARDQLGIKPLFICETPENIFFSSEIKALIPAVKLEPDYDSIKEYLVFRSLPGENTMFKNVCKLGAGHFGFWRNGVLRTSQYFNLAETLRPNSELNFESACAITEDCLSESIRLHLRSDVELGVQLSGGVDSSLVTALASKISGKRLHSFSISFAEAAFDESEYQKRVSERYATEHHDYRMDEKIFTSMLTDAIWHYEEGLNDPNSVATYYLALKAKEHVTVMLSGEGADETFLGYARFNPQSLAILHRRTFLYKHPALRKTLLALWLFAKGKDLFRITKYCPSVYALSYCDLNHIDEFLEGNDDGLFRFRKMISQEAGNDIVAQAILQDEICDLPQWFVRADKMGMAASLEFRVPFCTEKMFRLANSIPTHIKIYRGERKAVLKKIAEKYIDKDQIYRKKIGFGTPIDVWLNHKGHYSEIFDDTVNSQSFKSRDFISYPHFRKLYDAHKKGIYREINSCFLWTYFNLELWFRIFFETGMDGKVKRN